MVWMPTTVQIPKYTNKTENIDVRKKILSIYFTQIPYTKVRSGYEQDLLLIIF